MKKLWLIIQREYLVRVRKKTFILVTLLTPIAIIALYTLPVIIMKYTGNEQQKIAVKDDSGIIKALPSTSETHYQIMSEDLETLRKNYQKDGFTGVLYIPKIENLNNALNIQYYSEKQISMGGQRGIEKKIATKLRNYKIQEVGLTKQQIDNLDVDVTLQQKKQIINDKGEIEEEENNSSAGVAAAIGFGMAFFMYMVIFIYGMMVMRSVMEEKVNRIVEVIISSVKPFQLMLGKIIGVSGVGLTQMLIWALFVGIFGTVIMPLLIPAMADGASAGAGAEVSAEQMDEGMAMMQTLMQDIAAQNWAFMIPVIIVFFLGGYFIYASLFAAVGSAIGDDFGEGQSLTIPISIPVVIAFFIAMSVMDNPNSGIAVFGSMFPLFSPIVMPARLAFDPPLWEVLLSMVILIGSAVFFVWLSGRIYRIGIFMYGKKVTFKEIGKWLFYKG
jgi:ABC-2 type transport system permease protein